MSNRFANGAKAFAFCDLCGFRFDLKKLKNLTVKTKQTAIKACPQCWTPDHPQLQLGMYPVSDPQAIRDPRPDTNTWYASGQTALGTIGEGSRVIQWGWAPIGGASGFDAPLTPNDLVGRGYVGTVTITSTFVPSVITVNEAVMPATLLSAAINFQPERALFKDTLISGRPLGDVTDNGLVTSADSLAYIRYIAGEPQPQAYNDYITNVLNPYMIANPSTYSAYLIFT